MSQETISTLSVTDLKDNEVRDLQLFLSKSTILYPYFSKFAAENISLDLLLKSDNTFLKMICDHFNMKVGEYGALRILLRSGVEDTLVGLKSKQKTTSEINSNILSSGFSQSYNFSQSDPLNENIIQNPNQMNALQKIELKPNEKSDDQSLLQHEESKNSSGKEHLENYNDNTNEEFKIGKNFILKPLMLFRTRIRCAGQFRTRCSKKRKISRSSLYKKI